MGLVDRRQIEVHCRVKQYTGYMYVEFYLYTMIVHNGLH